MADASWILRTALQGLRPSRRRVSGSRVRDLGVKPKIHNLNLGTEFVGRGYMSADPTIGANGIRRFERSLEDARAGRFRRSTSRR
jgi:hypothetical protein